MQTIYDPRYKALIARLVSLREAGGLTQSDLAGRLGGLLVGFRQSDVSKVESLQRRLDVVEVADWLASLDQNAADVLGEFDWWAGESSPTDPTGNEAEFVPKPGSAVPSPNGGGVLVTLVGQGVQHEVEFPGASVPDYLEVEAETIRLFRSLNDASLNLKNRDAIFRALDFAMRKLQSVNPSDVYRHIVYRIYLREYARSQPKQSWVRAGGEGVELFIESWYRDALAARGIEIKALLSGEEKKSALNEMGIAGHVGKAKLDIALYGLHGGRRIIFGGIHSKASLAERVADDVPCSKAMMETGLLSVLWTFDAKDYPPRDLTNRGELGTPQTPSTKRDLIERDGAFDVCFSYNTRTFPSQPNTASGKRIFSSPLLLADPLPGYVSDFWQQFQMRNGLS
ncbi:MAG: hypothetical protein IAE99_01350 [Rhodothermales bacterium]|nr:hypothetical protein [Rhodothermales bacterium]